MRAAASVYVRFAGSCVPVCGRRSGDRAVWRAILASTSGPVRGGSAVVASDGGEPEIGDDNAAVPVDVVSTKSDVMFIACAGIVYRAPYDNKLPTMFRVSRSTEVQAPTSPTNQCRTCIIFLSTA